MIFASTKLNVPRHEKLARDISTGSGTYRVVLNSWERMYIAFITRRFDSYSRGGGNWKRNSPLTIALKRSSAILVNTREMRLKLPFAIRATAYSQRSVWMGFVSDAVHTPSGTSMADILTKHDKGIGVPRRQILALPDKATQNQLVARALKEIASGLRD